MKEALGQFPPVPSNANCFSGSFGADVKGASMSGGLAVSGVDLANARVLKAIQSGSITPGQGETVANIIELRRSVLETVNLHSRVEKLEASASHADRRPGPRMRFYLALTLRVPIAGG